MNDTATDAMIRIHVQDLAGESRMIDGDIGTSLMEIIRASGIEDIPAYCGGNCSCASCHVYIDPAFVALLPPASDGEDALLDGSGLRAAGSRLSCQIPAVAALDGIRLAIAPQQD